MHFIVSHSISFMCENDSSLHTHTATPLNLPSISDSGCACVHRLLARELRSEAGEAATAGLSGVGLEGAAACAALTSALSAAAEAVWGSDADEFYDFLTGALLKFRMLHAMDAM